MTKPEQEVVEEVGTQQSLSYCYDCELLKQLLIFAWYEEEKRAEGNHGDFESRKRLEVA